MKSIVKYILSLFLFYSCDSLDLKPKDYYGSGNFWNTTSQLQGFINGLYYDLRSTDRSIYLLGEARGGTSVLGTSVLGTSIVNTTPIKDNNFTKDNTGVSNWNGYYARILQVNIFIDNVESGCPFLTTSERNYFLGQAYGLRAYYYFNLYKIYGGVPIVDRAEVVDGATNAQDLYKGRSTPKETLDFVKLDINKSEAHFESEVLSKNPKSLWSKAATLMLKGEIYLWSAKVSNQDQTPGGEDLQIAKNAVSQLIGKFTLLPNFKDVFDCSKKDNDEIIFALRYLEGEATNWVQDFIYPGNYFVNQVYSNKGVLMGDTLEAKNTGFYFQVFKFELFEAYDAEDMRRDATFLDFYIKDEDGNTTAKGVVLRKAMGIINSTNNRIYITDIPIYRYAEAILLMAEIENKMGNDPSPYMNEIRKRAYGDSFDSAIHGYKDQGFALNELAILKERDKEFVWEGKRWYDICRMTDASGRALVFSADVSYGTPLPVLNYETEAHKVMWPVDVTTLNNDPNLKQTPGY
jgi:hypothetical protein